VIGFSSFGVLLYYAIANAAAFTQPADKRRWPRWLNLLGATGCLILLATLPWQAILAGLAMVTLGLTGRWLIQRRSRQRPSRGTWSYGPLRRR
jgi:basic amino acid/polyamine antiporter, APA family